MLIKARFYINISSVICSSGKGTTHCTNGIDIQRKPLSCALPPETSNNQNLSKKRSISCISTDVLPHHFRDSDRDLIRSKLISPPLNKPPRKLQLMHGSSTMAVHSAESRSKTRHFHWKIIKGRLYQRGRASTSNYARTVSHVNIQLVIAKLLKQVPQNFPQCIQCCKDLYKWLTS